MRQKDDTVRFVGFNRIDRLTNEKSLFSFMHEYNTERTLTDDVGAKLA